MLDLHEDHASQLAQLAAQAPESGVLPLDPADAAHRALIQHVLEASNKGPDRYPALHGAIQAAANNGPGTPDADRDDCTVVDMGQDSAGRATTRSWLGSRGKAFISGATTLLHDADTGALLASGAGSQVGGALSQVATKTDEAQPASAQMRAVTLFHAQQTPDTPPRFGLVAATRTTLTDPLDVHVDNPMPVNHTNPPAAITKIGLARPGPLPDMDYWYIGPMSENPDRLAVPFTGYANLATPIDTTRAILALTKVYVPGTPPAWVLPYPGFSITGGITVNGSKVTWNFPPDGLDISATKSLQYAPAANANELNSCFLYSFTVPIIGLGSPTITFTVCSKDTPGEPSIHCTQVPDIQFVWHCLGEDTTVTLADGQELAIADVDNTMSVRTGDGDAVEQVEATSRAYHDDNDGLDPALRLTTEGGASLLLSDGHPVITPNGPIAARDLRPGDTVHTAAGQDRVRTCDPEPYEGIVYNLAFPESDKVGTYLANGIVVGDHLAQGAYDRQTRHDPDYMLPRLPETHHQDYLSALADSPYAPQHS